VSCHSLRDHLVVLDDENLGHAHRDHAARDGVGVVKES
jgi:hypothetical protein